MTEDQEARCDGTGRLHEEGICVGRHDLPVTEDQEALRHECEVVLSIPQNQRSVQHGDAFYEAVLALLGSVTEDQEADVVRFAHGDEQDNHG